jgi:mannose/fructose/N-acetylgalactosamine-specific phosphotransferase system component IIB
MGVPPDMRVDFVSVDQAIERYASFASDPKPGMLLTGDIETMARLCAAIPALRRVNLGGVHHRAGRAQKLRYIFLTRDEEAGLRAMAERGVEISAQDVPAARVIPLDAILESEAIA